MPQIIRINKQEIEVASVNEAARYLCVTSHEIEHWIANNLLNGIYRDHDGEDYDCLIDVNVLRQLMAYIDRCPRYWSHEKMLWYHYITANRDEIQEDLATYRQFLKNKEQILHYNVKRKIT